MLIKIDREKNSSNSEEIDEEVEWKNKMIKKIKYEN